MARVLPTSVRERVEKPVEIVRDATVAVRKPTPALAVLARQGPKAGPHCRAPADHQPARATARLAAHVLAGHGVGVPTRGDLRSSDAHGLCRQSHMSRCVQPFPPHRLRHKSLPAGLSVVVSSSE